MGRKGFRHLQYSNTESLNDLYDSEYPSPPWQTAHWQGGFQFPNNDGDTISFQAIHFIYFYIDMHIMTGNGKWLTLAEGFTDHIISVSDKNRLDLTITPLTTPATAYFQAPYPFQVDGTKCSGWSSFDGNQGSGRQRIQILQDGQICGALASWADYVLSNQPALSAYETHANSVFAYIADVLNEHNNSWRYNQVSSSPDMTVQGNWYYPERISGTNNVSTTVLAFNHSAGACQAALLYHKHFTDAELLNKCEKFMEFTRDPLCRQEIDSHYYWPYTMETVGTSEDLNHGSYTFSFFQVAHENNYLNFTNSELTKYANSALNAWLGGKVGLVAEKFDGTGSIPSGEAFDPAHFGWLCDFNPTLYKMLRDLTGGYEVTDKPRGFRAASNLLRYQQSGIIN